MIVGKDKSLKDAGTVVGISTNSLMVFGSADRLPDDGKDAMMSEVIKVVTKISGGVKEEAGTVKSEVILETATAESADTLNQFIQGLLGMGKLKFASNPVMLDVVKGVIVTKDGNKIIVKGSIPSDILFNLIKDKGRTK